jgi:hypothetical protein
MAEVMTMKLIKDKDTKNKVKFAVGEDGVLGIDMSIYIDKLKMKEIGNPAVIKVTLEVE